MIGSPCLVLGATIRTLKSCSKSFSKTAQSFDRGVGFRRLQSSTTDSLCSLLIELRQLDTSSLCDADKTIASKSEGGSGIRLMDTTIRPMNHRFDTKPAIMVGVAHTVAFTEPNDFLPVMRALALEAKSDEVLVVNTLSSTRAVAGEIFGAEARRKGLAGIVIDGPIRDTAHLDQDDSSTECMRMYATGTTPYSGTTQSPGELQTPVACGGVEVRQGDIVMGDDDGILVGSFDAFSELIPIAKTIQEIEGTLVDGITCPTKGSLASMTNLEEHVQRRLEGKACNLEFRI